MGSGWVGEGKRANVKVKALYNCPWFRIFFSLFFFLILNINNNKNYSLVREATIGMNQARQSIYD
jgi:hypothetical protein